jgi:hypothetical protein
LIVCTGHGKTAILDGALLPALAEKLSIRIRVCLQAYRKSLKMGPAFAAAEEPRFWVAQRFQRCDSRPRMYQGF